MYRPLIIATIVLGAISIVAMAWAADATDQFRKQFEIPGKLQIVSARSEDVTTDQNGVHWEVVCRILQRGTCTFHFDPVGHADEEVVLAAKLPMPPPTTLSSVLPGGIHGGPPSLYLHPVHPMVLRDDRDESLVKLRWAFGGLDEQHQPRGYQMIRCEFKSDAPATEPTSQPSG